jgi:hypothetical protein
MGLNRFNKEELSVGDLVVIVDSGAVRERRVTKVLKTSVKLDDGTAVNSFGVVGNPGAKVYTQRAYAAELKDREAKAREEEMRQVFVDLAFPRIALPKFPHMSYSTWRAHLAIPESDSRVLIAQIDNLVEKLQAAREYLLKHPDLQKRLDEG